MPFDKQKNQRKAFGFITFEREDTMKELVTKGKVQIGEHEIDIRKAQPKGDNYSGGGGGGYGGGYGAEYFGGGYDYYGYGADYYGGWGGGYGSWGGGNCI